MSLFASANPDGLEWAVSKATEQTLGSETEIEASGGIFDGAASVQENIAFLPDYAFSSDPENAAGTSVSGIVAPAITFVLAGATGVVISKVKKRESAKLNA